MGHVVQTDKTIIYYNDHNQYHREDGPAVESLINELGCYANGVHSTIKYPHKSKAWYKHGLLHREDGPAMVYPSGSLAWYQNGILHNSKGPAVVGYDGTWQYWLNGKFLTEEEWRLIVFVNKL